MSRVQRQPGMDAPPGFDFIPPRRIKFASQNMHDGHIFQANLDPRRGLDARQIVVDPVADSSVRRAPGQPNLSVVELQCQDSHRARHMDDNRLGFKLCR